MSLRHGVRLVPQLSSTVEQVLLAVGEQVGHDNISYASRMNKALVIFFKDPDSVTKLIESGLTLDEEFIQVSPLAVASTRITVSGVPPFIPNEALERELRRFGKFASGFRAVALGCRDLKLKHVQSLRRQVFMFLDAASQTLDVSFRVRHEEQFYMVYASSGSMKCFQCGEVGHKKVTCPHGRRERGAAGAEGGEGSAGVTKPAWGRAAGSAASSVAAGSAAAGSAEAGSVAIVPAEAGSVDAVPVDAGSVAAGSGGCRSGGGGFGGCRSGCGRSGGGGISGGRSGGCRFGCGGISGGRSGGRTG